MIKENQTMLNRLNVLTDGLIVFLALPLAFWIRFYILPGGIISVPFEEYLVIAALAVPLFLFTNAAFGLYESFRKKSIPQELRLLLAACSLDTILLLTYLFLRHQNHFSRGSIAIFYLLVVLASGGKRIFLRSMLRYYRQRGYNLKHVVILGNSKMAHKYLNTIQSDKELGYHALGYVSPADAWRGIRYLGAYDHLERILEKSRPDEVICAIPVEDYSHMPEIIAACEKTGIKLSIIPFYAEYMPSNPQFDDLAGIPLVNIRRIPLDNWANAFCKRLTDLVGAALLIALFSPVMLVVAIGVRFSSPGPIIFRQKRVGRNKRIFSMYKFRSMRVNAQQDTGWSRTSDDRKTRFGSFIRKFSLDELPQFFNVLKGDMSLVGPRPEVPFYVEQFKEEIPLYMVKHQVRPGITGWAQVNGLRGDTSIKARVEHDIYYIEHWSLLFDLKILFLTLFKGFVNSEKLQ